MPPASVQIWGALAVTRRLPAARRTMKNRNKMKMLRLILAVLVLALIAVGGYILWQEYQYGVSEDYYESLRDIGLVKGWWRL